LSNARSDTFADGSVEGYALTDDVTIAEDEQTFLTLELMVLWCATEYRSRIDGAFASEPGAGKNAHMGDQLGTFADMHVIVNDAIGTYDHGIGKIGAWMNYG